MQSTQGNIHHPAWPGHSGNTVFSERGIKRIFEGRRVAYAFSTRVAIRKACDLLDLGPGTEVLAPAYNCGSELDPILQAGAAVRLYPVSETLETDVAAVERMIGPATRAIYVIHYFGVINPATRDLRALCDRHGLRLIEDCALSLLSGASPADGRAGDVAVFCFYKTFSFPVVQGGALVVNDPAINLQPFGRPAPEYRVFRQVLRQTLMLLPGARRLRRSLLGRKERGSNVVQAPLAEECPDMPVHDYFDPDLQDRAISRFTMVALGRIEVGRAILQRRANYAALAAALAGVPGIQLLWSELPPDACPLGLPVRLSNRDGVAKRMTAVGLPVPPWWAGCNRRLDWKASETAAALTLKREVLLLPVDQGRGTSEMVTIAAALRKAMTAA